MCLLLDIGWPVSAATSTVDAFYTARAVEQVLAGASLIHFLEVSQSRVAAPPRWRQPGAGAAASL